MSTVNVVCKRYSVFILIIILTSRYVSRGKHLTDAEGNLLKG